jgi:hypothetical protein
VPFALLLFVGPGAGCAGGEGDTVTGEINQADSVPCVCPPLTMSQSMAAPNGKKPPPPPPPPHYPASCPSASCTTNPCMPLNCVAVNTQDGVGHCALNGPWLPDGTPCGGTSTCQSGVCTP